MYRRKKPTFQNSPHFSDFIDYSRFFSRIASYFTVLNMHENYDEQFGEETVNTIISSDPTYLGGDQIGSYTPWIIKILQSGGTDLDQLGVVTEALNLFNRYKPNLEVKDIYQYSSLDNLLGAIQPYLPKAVPLSDKSEDIIYDDGIWMLVVPYTYEASCEWGEGTEWCTTNIHGPESGRQTFERALQNSYLFILINKQTGDKYQFDNASRQFRDKEDQESFQDFLDKQPPYELLKVIQNVAPNALSTKIEEIRSDQEYNLGKQIRDVIDTDTVINFFLKEYGINHTYKRPYESHEGENFDSILLDTILYSDISAYVNSSEHLDQIPDVEEQVLKAIDKFHMIISVLQEKGFDINPRSSRLVVNPELKITLDPTKLTDSRWYESKEEFEQYLDIILQNKLNRRKLKNSPEKNQFLRIDPGRMDPSLRDTEAVQLGIQLLQLLPDKFDYATARNLAGENEKASAIIGDIQDAINGSWRITHFNDRFQRYMKILERAGLVVKYQNPATFRIYWEKVNV